MIVLFHITTEIIVNGHSVVRAYAPIGLTDWN